MVQVGAGGTQQDGQLVLVALSRGGAEPFEKVHGMPPQPGPGVGEVPPGGEAEEDGGHVIADLAAQGDLP
ncbi:MAG: hypothetical protein L0L69_09715 [Propionibacterium sp.]|nr:hypothetical protein [Actinomyces sp.]MDN6795305.1 hypothetical protein [Propionibacterium sp.]